MNERELEVVIAEDIFRKEFHLDAKFIITGYAKKAKAFDMGFTNGVMSIGCSIGLEPLEKAVFFKQQEREMEAEAAEEVEAKPIKKSLKKVK